VIKCPVCSNQEMEGAIFCRECGAQLAFGEGLRTTNIKVSPGFESEKSAENNLSNSQFDPSTLAPDVVAKLHLLKSGVFLPIVETQEVIIGRASEGQSLLPDIDLGPFQAFEAGVSRLHATLRVTSDGVIITDLGSSNGTSINGLKIEPQVPYRLTNGDVVSLGKLKIEIIVSEKQG
jgi:pSer/pThr/pTyr-binding forkhead associated (FHA) protein